jgi:ABC-type phosphate transport system substrate-binding protein
MKMYKTLFSALILSGVTMMSQAGVAVVVGASSPLAGSTMSEDDVNKIFLGKAKDHNGVQVVPVDQNEGAASRDDFYTNVIKKSEAQLKSYWSRLIFTGKGQAPQVVGADADVKSMVSSNPNLVGYISSGAVDGSVKVLYQQ